MNEMHKPLSIPPVNQIKESMMKDNKYPIGGFAPGNYQCKCCQISNYEFLSEYIKKNILPFMKDYFDTFNNKTKTKK